MGRAGRVRVCARANVRVRVLIDCILFTFPGCKFRSMLANRQHPGGNFITRITNAISPKPNSTSQ